jgi:8-oxo-dGTP pyrophosphatase MutT (NUDIX family)
LAVVDWYRDNPRRMPHMQLGVVGAVFDSAGRVLLTRRAPRMRSFPGSWVLPGGGLDPGESMADAVTREVREETGVALDEDSVRPVGLWESVYPTSTADCIVGGTGITAHYFVVFYAALARVHRPEVTLQTEETDLAVWLSADQLAETLAHPRGGASGTVDVAASATGGQRSILLDELAGIYPRRSVTSPIDSGREEDVPGVGIAQGNLFILSELLREGKQGTSSSMFFGIPGAAPPKL